MNKKLSNVLEYLKHFAIAILLAVTIINVFYLLKKTFTNNPCPTIFGTGMAVVISHSMEPEISRYDLVIISTQDEYNVGDVITYNDGGTPVTHRIVEKYQEGEETMIVTQGDANDSKDYPIKECQIIGKVVMTIPEVGSVQIFLQDNILLLVMVGVSLLIITELLKEEGIKYIKLDEYK